MTKREDVKELVRKGKERFGQIEGIIHAAGVLRDSFIIKKPRKDMELVSKAKILGAVNLDAETKTEALDFFVTFASIAGVVGNVGQSDYAYANRFLDYFAEWRDAESREGRRHGKTLSIDWSLWADGGMMVDEEVKKWLRNKLGMSLIKTENGLEAFGKAINYPARNVIIIEGRERRCQEAIGGCHNNGNESGRARISR